MPLLAATAAMGARFELVLDGPDPRLLRAAADEIIADILRWHGRLSRFDPASDARRLAREAAGRWAPVDRDLFDLLTLCEQGRAASCGAFCVATFDRGDGRALGLGVDLDPAACAVRFGPADRGPGAPAEPFAAAVAGVTLDFGAVAKGFVLDRAAEALRGWGVRSAFMQGGASSAIGLGRPATSDAWRVGISAGGPVVQLRDAALSVTRSIASAEAGDPRHGERHLVDPRSGHPVAGAARLAAVVGPSAAVCEVWSTSVAVLGGFQPDPPGSWPDGYAGRLEEAGRAPLAHGPWDRYGLAAAGAPADKEWAAA